MAEIVKFIYVLIIFISLTFVAKNINGFTCDEDSDCPQDKCPPRFEAKCFLNICLCGRNMFQ
ncbi:unnamed protein product [Lathyrus oleraceus]